MLNQQEKINGFAYTILMKSWEYIYPAPFKITKCTKLRWIQTCIKHKSLVTNKFRYQIKMIDSPNCCFVVIMKSPLIIYSGIALEPNNL